MPTLLTLYITGKLKKNVTVYFLSIIHTQNVYIKIYSRNRKMLNIFLVEQVASVSNLLSTQLTSIDDTGRSKGGGGAFLLVNFFHFVRCSVKFLPNKNEFQ